MAQKDNKKRMRDIQASRRKKILKATNDGKCWWLYQQLIANPNPKKYRTSK